MNCREPKVIVVFGLPGSGKSTFARALASAVQGRVISTDNVRSEMRLRGEYALHSKTQVYHRMLDLMDETIRHGSTVVLDGTYYKENLRRLVVKRANDLNRIPHFIEVRASEKVIKERLAERRADSDADYHVYLKIKAEFEPMASYHLIINSDIEPPERALTEALAYTGSYELH